MEFVRALFRCALCSTIGKADSMEVAEGNSCDNNMTVEETRRADTMEVAEGNSCDNNMRVEEARRADTMEVAEGNSCDNNMRVEEARRADSMEVAEGSSCDNNKRVAEARRARVLWLERLRRECSSEEEFEKARSQPTWTELDSTSCSSSSSCSPYVPSAADLERVRHENRLHFQHLLNSERPWPRIRTSAFCEKPVFETDLFFIDCGGKLELGQKIGGGGQAEIYRAIYDGKVLDSYVLKVFRNDYHLADLQRSWMKNIPEVSMFLRGFKQFTYCVADYGTLLQDGRFAFIMRLCWGDLRKAIDLAILKDRTHQSPPFVHRRTYDLMYSIANGMLVLHFCGVLHRDLKGDNCLLLVNPEDRPCGVGTIGCIVADFDSPQGVIGTGFWRAPEVLLALKNKVSNPSSHLGLWTEKADVYSYAMTCYEILTGCIPFENRAMNDYNGVICGERPPMPDYVDLELGELVKKCWHPEPSQRPTFIEIEDKLRRIRPKFVS